MEKEYYNIMKYESDWMILFQFFLFMIYERFIDYILFIKNEIILELIK